MGFWIVNNLYCTTITLMLIVIGIRNQSVPNCYFIRNALAQNYRVTTGSFELYRAKFSWLFLPAAFRFFYSYRNDWLIRKSYLVLIFLFFLYWKINIYKLKCTVAWPWMIKKKNQREDAVVWRRAMYRYISQPPMIDFCEQERKRN